jgi:uncharacterized membrane protein YfcA
VVGGGVLLLPILIFTEGASYRAVGSDALFNFFTKIPAGLLHLRKGGARR